MPEQVLRDLIDETVCPPECLDFIKCVLCKKSLTRQSVDILGSRLLICCHSICLSCAESWNNEETRACPACNFILPKDLLENKILQEMVEEPIPEAFLEGVCFEHKNIKTTKWCNECSTLVCDSCIENHKTLLVIRSHTIIDVKDTLPTSNKTLATFQCHQHPNCKLDMYCENCDHITCRDCQLELHKRHSYQFLSESKACQGFRKDLFLKCCRIEQTERSLVISKQAIEDLKTDLLQQKDDIRTKIDDLFKKIVESIEVRFEELKNQLDSEINKEMCGLDHDLKETESMITPLKHCLNVFNLILKSSDVALLYSKKHLEKCFEQVLRKDVRVYNEEVKKKINFYPGSNVDQLFEMLRTIGKLQGAEKCDGTQIIYDDIQTSNTVSAPTPARIQLRQDLQQPTPEIQLPTEWSPMDTSSIPQLNSNMPHWHIPQEPTTSKQAPVAVASAVPDPVANSNYNALAQITALTLSQELINNSHVYTSAATPQSVSTTTNYSVPAQTYPQRVTAAAQSPENRHPTPGRKQPQLTITPNQARPQGKAQGRSLSQGHSRSQGQRQVRPQGPAQSKPQSQPPLPMSVPPPSAYSYRGAAPLTAYSTANTTTQYPRNNYPAVLQNNSSISLPSVSFQLAQPQQQTQHQTPQHPQILQEQSQLMVVPSPGLPSLQDYIAYIPGSTHTPYSQP